MLKINFKRNRRVEVEEPIRSSKEDYWYSNFDATSRELEDLNESLFKSNYRLMNRLETIQKSF